jgi:hypothetical protein
VNGGVEVLTVGSYGGKALFIQKLRELLASCPNPFSYIAFVSIEGAIQIIQHRQELTDQPFRSGLVDTFSLPLHTLAGILEIGLHPPHIVQIFVPFLLYRLKFLPENGELILRFLLGIEFYGLGLFGFFAALFLVQDHLSEYACGEEKGDRSVSPAMLLFPSLLLALLLVYHFGILDYVLL